MQTARLLPWIVTALLLGSCRPTTAVTVNGETVPLAEVEQAAQLAGTRSDDPQVLASIVAERLILQDAEAQGIVVPAAELEAAVALATQEAGGTESLRRQLRQAGFTMRRFRHDLRGRLTVASYQDWLSAGLDVSDEEVRAWHEQNRTTFTEPESWAVTLLIYDQEAAALAARERLQGGASASELLTEAGAGSGPSEVSGSETSPWRRRLFDAARETPFGEASPVLEWQERYHLVVPNGYFRAHEPSFEEIESTLRAHLEQQALQTLLELRLAELRSEAVVVWGAIQPASGAD